MKKLIRGIIIASVFSAGAAQAAGENDMSATLNINGSVKNGNGTCTVVPSVTAVSLGARDVNVLPLQDTGRPADTTLVTFQVTGDQSCTDKIKASQIGVKFVGTADNANGTALANDDQGSTAAKGVGIGLYSNASINEIYKINRDYITVGELANSFGMGMVQLNGQTPVAGSVHGSLTLEVVRL